MRRRAAPRGRGRRGRRRARAAPRPGRCDRLRRPAEAARPARRRHRRARPRRPPPRRAAAPSARAANRKVSGAGLPFRCSRSADDAVDQHLEEILDAGRRQDLAAVRARRDDGAAQPRLPRRLHVPDRARIHLDALVPNHSHHELILPVPEAGDRLRIRGVAGSPWEARSRATRGTRARRRSEAGRRRTGRSRRAGSNGTKEPPVCAARSRRKSSNISFHAAACTFAVCVSTPSRSNRHARIAAGSPTVSFGPVAMQPSYAVIVTRDAGRLLDGQWNLYRMAAETRPTSSRHRDESIRSTGR